jgi:hypothetical protein
MESHRLILCTPAASAIGNGASLFIGKYTEAQVPLGPQNGVVKTPGVNDLIYPPIYANFR